MNTGSDSTSEGRSSQLQAHAHAAPAAPTDAGTKDHTDSWLVTLNNALTLTMVFAIATGFLVLMVQVAMALHRDPESETVKDRMDAGSLIRLELSGGVFTHVLVETSVGFYTRSGPASLAKGEHLFLETRANNARFLCDGNRVCNGLMT
jgi:hypothetical protein